MTHAARWTGLVATAATLCRGAAGISVDSEGAETARIAEVLAIGPAGAWTQPLARGARAVRQRALRSRVLKRLPPR